jgi:hypothetical protein
MERFGQAESFSKSIITDYSIGLRSDPLLWESLKYVAVLGSFGRDEAKLDSDLDTWLVITDKQASNFTHIALLNFRESMIREGLFTKLGKSSQLRRHPPAYFSESEVNMYCRAFPTRIGLLLKEKAFPVIKGELPTFEVDEKLLLEDAAVSLAEFSVKVSDDFPI